MPAPTTEATLKVVVDIPELAPQEADENRGGGRPARHRAPKEPE